MRSLYRSLLSKTTSPFPLAAFRILFGVSLLCEIVHAIRFQALLFDPIAYLIPDTRGYKLLLGPWLAATLAITLGYRMRIAAAIAYAINVIVLGRFFMDTGRDWHVDGLFIAGPLFLCFAPADRVWSLRRLLEVRRARAQGASSPPLLGVPAFYSFLLLVAIANLYLDSVLWKLTSPMWRAGMGFCGPGSLPFATYMDISPLLSSRFVCMVAGYVPFVFEALFFLLIWFRPLQLPLLLMGVALHVGIAVAFPIPHFSLLMLSLYAGIVPDRMYAAAFARAGFALPAHAPPDPPSRAQAGALAFVLVAWWVSMIAIGFASPLPAAIAGRGPIVDALSRLGWRYKNAVYPYTGLSTHGVFMDYHFENYRTQTMLVFHGPEGEQIVPTCTPRGHAGPHAWNRSWVFWTFHAAKPGISPRERQINLMRFAASWAGEHGIAPESGEFAVRVRPLRFSLIEWRPGTLQRSLDDPGWREIGRFKLPVPE